MNPTPRGIGCRLNNVAQNEGKSLEELAQEYTDQQLLRIPNFGHKSLRYLRELHGQAAPGELDGFSDKHLEAELRRRRVPSRVPKRLVKNRPPTEAMMKAGTAVVQKQFPTTAEWWCEYFARQVYQAMQIAEPVA